VFEIRIMNPDEVEQVCRVDREAFFESRYGALTGLRELPPEEQARWQSVRDFNAYCRRRPDRVVVAAEGGRVVGFVSLDFLDDGTGKIKNLGVAPSHRGRGIGVALVERSLGELRSRGVPRAVVSTSHVPEACRMYEKAGFRLVDRKVKCAPDGTPYHDSRYEILFEKEEAPAGA
jgi:ribosomal protein S18 acetylase RimI-like enzyme